MGAGGRDGKKGEEKRRTEEEEEEGEDPVSLYYLIKFHIRTVIVVPGKQPPWRNAGLLGACHCTWVYSWLYHTA